MFNNKGLKEFSDPHSAVKYLNDQLSSDNVNPELDYVFIAPKVTAKHLKHSIQEYIGIGKLFIKD
jgi:hypothetical protein